MISMVLLSALLAYLVGSFPTSIVFCRLLKGIDIRKIGSGNPGATNVYRACGWRIALLVLAIDALKGTFGVYVPVFFLSNMPQFQEYRTLFMACGGLMAIGGHIWTVFAGFKGGKGVGTALGFLLAINPLPALAGLTAWIVVVAFARIVSLASLSAVIVMAGITCAMHWQSNNTLVYLALFMVALIFFTHRSNIRRLLNGHENKISFGKKKDSV
ncbi:MAG: acyl-phosphate glycerol 3-phosphate acyltransferase [Candidatus Raymondbacteria bacterium RifOxyA12_full_50_37]|uniref:Glycerol-3-phosphate acyltransferase n=1 Tax=Candidatus Raymondbacteria bacterium RIFOXYD12_FULL_49_13 TaxID=1817890 RepID=A0A1F7F1N5_UNCRA|nr:MAG: acyl-phosphate glycerol 3-phosphate acyltransferase [Candidatus Raymondbacteria bacterium RifOxyA12_full_50_37]OGJ93141.1 MAG: acyl-phosphate glycerol 3-phosphate acyltransferase [Candidatus Raymondbacteria bacterium RifOxyB12_full_50_8]OGJ93907.1 MAG: acyl-phosphate glycerol 3-phosphate acyltransferase [Candidatus Raymondbacteria bacterium RIFOXYA2_FULL_49_16]OGJ98224.1 MAG: acyl-phosphate glycerol 3-phosphate acyltransferase [Candidatus Raymondbacteria bacterium RIFOXYC2_FULL_50_21]OG